MKKFFRALISILGFAVLPCVIALFYTAFESMTGINLSEQIIYWVNILIYVVAAIISGIIFIILSKPKFFASIKIIIICKKIVDIPCVLVIITNEPGE